MKHEDFMFLFLANIIENIVKTIKRKPLGL